MTIKNIFDRLLYYTVFSFMSVVFMLGVKFVYEWATR